MAELIEELISTSYFNAFLLRKRVQSLFLQVYPTKIPVFLLEFYDNLFKEYQLRLVSLRSEYDHSPDDVLKQVKLLAAHLRDLAAHIRYVEGSSVQKTPSSFASSLEKFVQKILPDSKLIIRAQWHYNFKIFDLVNSYKPPLSRALSARKFEELAAKLGDRLYVISFPGFERDNILILTTLGHELGHPIADSFLEQEDKTYISDIEEQVEKSISTKLTPLERLEKKSIY